MICLLHTRFKVQYMYIFTKVYSQQTGEEFFEALENSFSEHCDVVEFLINLTEKIRLHVDDGATKMADTLRQYLQSLKEYDEELTAKGLGKKCFVGRQNELDRILRTIKYDKCVKGTYLKIFLKSFWSQNIDLLMIKLLSILFL